jgi:uncharacterized membrane protein YccF (DUF307 family)
LIAFPLGAAIVAAIFALATWRAAKPQDTALRIWSVALMQFAIASAAIVWGIAFGWTPLVYKAFYLFGAVLNVAWLALGTVWLEAPRKVAAVVNVLFIVAATIASGLVMSAELLPGAREALASHALPAPADIMPDVPRVLSRIFSSGGSVVVLFGLLSALARRRRPVGMALLALGVLIAGFGSTMIRAGRVEYFSVSLAAGIGVMYAGFLRTRG